MGPQVVDEEAARFIASCVGTPEQRHTAAQLLEDPFLLVGLQTHWHCSVALQQHTARTACLQFDMCQHGSVPTQHSADCRVQCMQTQASMCGNAASQHLSTASAV